MDGRGNVSAINRTIAARMALDTPGVSILISRKVLRPVVELAEQSLLEKDKAQETIDQQKETIRRQKEIIKEHEKTSNFLKERNSRKIMDLEKKVEWEEKMKNKYHQDYLDLVEANRLNDKANGSRAIKNSANY